VVESHSPIAAADESEGFVWSFQHWEKLLVLNDRRSIRIPIANSSVSGS
jgi:hypothetical protein